MLQKISQSYISFSVQKNRLTILYVFNIFSTFHSLIIHTNVICAYYIIYSFTFKNKTFINDSFSDLAQTYSVKYMFNIVVV